MSQTLHWGVDFAKASWSLSDNPLSAVLLGEALVSRMALYAKSSPDWNTDKAAILAVGSPATRFVQLCLELKGEDPETDYLIVSPGPEAIRQIHRRQFAVVLLEESPSVAGNLELILEGLSKDRSPGFVIFSDRGRSLNPSKPLKIRLLQPGGKQQLASLLASCIKEFQEGLQPERMPLTDLLEAIAGYPDEGWLRIANQQGETGDLCLRQGDLIYAETGRLSGAQAFERMLRWTSCSFEYRELPAFLNQNMQRAIREAISTKAQKQFSLPATKLLEPEPVELEEPSDFPLFEFSDTAYPPAGASGSDLVAEPEELPAFLFGAPEEDMQVEEPSELPAFSVAEDQERAAPARRTPPSLPAAFASLAIWGAGGLEYCDPPHAESQFHHEDLQKLYEEAKRCGRRHGGGNTHLICLHTDAGSLALAVIPDGRTMVAVALKGFGFGPEEASQLHRFLEQLTVTGSVLAR